MSKRGKHREAEGRGEMKRRVARWWVGGAVLVVLAGGALWWRLGPEAGSAGTPRLVVDRTDVDLGDRRFDTLARVAFTLTNAGDSPLRLKEVPPVKVVAGC